MMTPLHYACHSGHLDCIEILLQQGCDLETQDNRGFTPLLTAANNGYTQITGLLVNHGANIEAKAKNSWTPLMFSAAFGHIGVTRILLSIHCDLEYRNLQGLTAFLVAVKMGEQESVKLLLQHGCDSTVCDREGNTGLHIAAINRRGACAKVLIGHGLDIEAKNNNGYTALFAAIESGDLSIVELLVDAGCDVNDNRNKFGVSPLMLAVRAFRGHRLCMKILLLAGANVRLSDNIGRTVLDVAIVSCHWDVTCINLLYAAGAQASYCQIDRKDEKHMEYLKIILDDQIDMLPLTWMCRRRLRLQLLSPEGGFCNNLFLAVPRLPLPKRLKEFLLFFADIHCAFADKNVIALSQ